MKKILRAAIAIALILWLGAIAKCEILTLLHSDEFAAAYQSVPMITDVEGFKVLDRDKWFARVYYKGNDGGHVLLFSRDIGGWEVIDWYTVWSRQGSADDLIWPYIR